ncbi:hypothetical protein DKX38_000833 [Salix brachista]|uniref:K-box domain-containing protein n=1 Tax=Salix brachista TaxID=2182728 RepID=A0A5N5P2H9_9ROSI|nr:hypothetical protein DKX38_000833 [Salix brachista]
MLTVSRFTWAGCPFLDTGNGQLSVILYARCHHMRAWISREGKQFHYDMLFATNLLDDMSMNKTIERYQKRAKDAGISSKMGKDNMEPVKEDTFTLAKKIEHLEISKRKLLGDGLEPCSIDELNQLENQLERSLTRIRARKNQLFREQIEKLKGEEKILMEENTKLREKCGMQPLDLSSAKTPQGLQERQIVEVETELSIGPPKPKPQGLIIRVK